MKTKKPSQTERRNFIKTLGGATAAMAALPALASGQAPAPPRKAGAKYMGDFAAPKIPKVRIAMIGVGARGSGHASQLASIDGTEIVAISDLYEDLAKRSEQRVAAKGHKPKLYFGDPALYRTMLTEVKPDMVVVATPWEAHAEMGVAAMKAGAHVFIETPIAVTMDEMWQLVNTSEETGRHCMHMENVCYGREELLYLNMVRQGLIGEVLHGEAAYIHDLREQMKQVDRGTGSWRTYHYIRRNGNLYPCHGLGTSSRSRRRRGCARSTRRRTSPPITSGTRRSSSPATSTRPSSRPPSGGRSWSSGTSSPRARTRATT
jgi:hypothetical protein